MELRAGRIRAFMGGLVPDMRLVVRTGDEQPPALRSTRPGLGLSLHRLLEMLEHVAHHDSVERRRPRNGSECAFPRRSRSACLVLRPSARAPPSAGATPPHGSRRTRCRGSRARTPRATRCSSRCREFCRSCPGSPAAAARGCPDDWQAPAGAARPESGAGTGLRAIVSIKKARLSGVRTSSEERQEIGAAGVARRGILLRHLAPALPQLPDPAPRAFDPVALLVQQAAWSAAGSRHRCGE